MSVLKKYDFSSVGELEEDFIKRKDLLDDQRLQIPIGIKVPLSLGENSDGIFKMYYSIDQAVSSNFKNMLMTNHGERVGLYDFGANLHELAFELGTEEGDTEAIRRIRKTTTKYMPFISLLTFEPIVLREDNEHVAKIGVRVGYKISSLDPDEKLIEVVVYTAG